MHAIHRSLTTAVTAVAVNVALILATIAGPTATRAEAQSGETGVLVATEAEFRQAVADLSADATGPHTITLGADIRLEGAADPVYSGTQPLTLDGQGRAFTIRGENNSRILFGSTSATLTLRGVSVVAGHASGAGFTAGGAVNWGGPVVVENSYLSGNRATSSGSSALGGAIYSEDDITVSSSRLDDNQAVSTGGGATGGALRTNGGGTVTVTDSEFTLNEAVGSTVASGGAILGTGPVEISNSILQGNTAEGPLNAEGGGVYGSAGVTINGSRLNDNRAEGQGSGGGGVFAVGSATVEDSLFNKNVLEGSSGKGAAVLADSGTATVRSSTVLQSISFGSGSAGAVAGSSVNLVHATIGRNTADVTANVWSSGTITSFASVVHDARGGGVNCAALATVTNGYNFDDAGTCGFVGPTDIQNGGDPAISPLRDNGDVVAATELAGLGISRLSLFPLGGSPLVDAIPPAACSTDAADGTDQRGVPRPFGAGCDIGAIEAVFPAHAFSDVTPFYEAAVRWITSGVNTPNILDGFTNGTFRQTQDITRGQAARLYYRAAGEPDVSSLPAHGFTDVTIFFEDAVRWAKDEGIFDGFPDGTFRQANPISRGNFTRSLYGFVGAPDASALPAHGFSDVTPFYDDAVRWAKVNGLADGFANGTFRQKNNISRGNTARIVYNTALHPDAWLDPDLAPRSMLFRTG